jgi:hypothetical protein
MMQLPLFSLRASMALCLLFLKKNKSQSQYTAIKIPKEVKLGNLEYQFAKLIGFGINVMEKRPYLASTSKSCD